MCIHEETDIIWAQCFNRTVDLIGKRRELIIDHQRSIFTNEHTDVTAGAFQKIKVFSHLHRPDPDSIKIFLRLNEQARNTKGKN